MTAATAGDRVSVALCTYNGARFLAQQLDSLLAQTHPPYELVAADDASSDDTWEVLQRYAPRFARVRLIRNASNLGLRANFQQAFAACTGDWIAPCDQDDIWEPDKLATLLRAAADKHLLAYSDSALVDENGRHSGANVSDHLRLICGHRPLAFVSRNCVSGHACIFRRELLALASPLPEGLHYDWWLAFVASSRGSICHVDRPLVRFRRHANTVTALGRERRRRTRLSPLEQQRAKSGMLRVLAAVPGPEQAVLARLARLWAEREQRWFSLALARMMYRHHAELQAIDRRADSRPAARLLSFMKHLPGLRLKMVLWGALRRLGLA